MYYTGCITPGVLYPNHTVIQWLYPSFGPINTSCLINIVYLYKICITNIYRHKSSPIQASIYTIEYIDSILLIHTSYLIPVYLHYLWPFLKFIFKLLFQQQKKIKFGWLKTFLKQKNQMIQLIDSSFFVHDAMRSVKLNQWNLDQIQNFRITFE